MIPNLVRQDSNTPIMIWNAPDVATAPITNCLQIDFLITHENNPKELNRVYFEKNRLIKSRLADDDPIISGLPGRDGLSGSNRYAYGNLS